MNESTRPHPSDQPDHHEALSAYFAAMRRGPAAEHDLLSLFTEDAVYHEPFSGVAHPAVGLEAIRQRMRLGWQTPLPDMELDVLSVIVDGDVATSTWECRSPVFEEPARGADHYRFRDGRICELRVTLGEPRT